eukprot:TRINITY_DN417_c0_g1_i1.p1 TRINITY_DN417_c0_g1~~TRINITY_DN417_c0_g1_i1.p1  ORF type:complete len:202 (-),score=12.16 TRINITY_DN417_c0_g1_i1:90-695(-)
MDKIDQHIAEVKEIWKSTTGWVETHNTPNVVGSKREQPGTPLETYRAVGYLDTDPKTALETLWSWGPAEWKAYDANMLVWEAKEVHENHKIIYQVNKLTWPVSNRDMAMFQIRHEDNGAFFLFLTSQGVPQDQYPVAEGAVRCSINISAFIFEPTGEEGKCKFTRLVNVDPAGSIPTMVINWQAGNIYNAVADMNKILGKK